MVEIVEKAEPKVMGFSVTSAPLWLCKKLKDESDQWYGGSYAPVIVGWYRKAQEFDNIVRGGLPPPSEAKDEIPVEEKDEGVSLMGGHRGR